MAGNEAVAIAFWSDLDETFKYNPSNEVQQLYRDLFSQPSSPFDFSRILKLWRKHRSVGTYPAGFLSDISPLRASFERLAQLQLDVFDRHFVANTSTEQAAFELFGQGVLYDGSRPIGDKIHLMDTGGPSNPPIGYHRWHTFVRCAQLLGINPPRWLTINREIGLAWAIQSELKPIPDSRTNPPMAEDRLGLLRSQWLSRSPDDLDTAFDSFPYPPAPNPVSPVSLSLLSTSSKVDLPKSQVEQIKAILEELVGQQKIPAHGNFWRNFKTGAGFINFQVFGIPDLQLLVNKDADASNLVKALEGTPPFDGSSFPRMPVPGAARRYATPAEIKIIRDWINAGCP